MSILTTVTVTTGPLQERSHPGADASLFFCRFTATRAVPMFYRVLLVSTHRSDLSASFRASTPGRKVLPVASERGAVKPTTIQSRRTSPRRGRSRGPQGSPARQSPTGRALSSASSRCRPALRASIKLPTLAQAISNTNPTAPSNTSNAGRTLPTTCPKLGFRLTSAGANLLTALHHTAGAGTRSPPVLLAPSSAGFRACEPLKTCVLLRN